MKRGQRNKFKIMEASLQDIHRELLKKPDDMKSINTTRPSGILLGYLQGDFNLDAGVEAINHLVAGTAVKVPSKQLGIRRKYGRLTFEMFRQNRSKQIWHVMLREDDPPQLVAEIMWCEAKRKYKAEFDQEGVVLVLEDLQGIDEFTTNLNRLRNTLRKRGADA